nr:Uncharacterised protein [Ipomoea trifida]
MATLITGSGKSMRSSTTAVSGSHNVSPDPALSFPEYTLTNVRDPTKGSLMILNASPVNGSSSLAARSMMTSGFSGSDPFIGGKSTGEGSTPSRSAGMSSYANLAPNSSPDQTMAFICTRSTTPLKLSSAPIGIWITSGFAPKFYTRNTVKQAYGTVQNSEGPFYFKCEVDMTGRINYVNPVLVPESSSRSRSNEKGEYTISRHGEDGETIPSAVFTQSEIPGSSGGAEADAPEEFRGERLGSGGGAAAALVLGRNGAGNGSS